MSVCDPLKQSTSIMSPYFTGTAGATAYTSQNSLLMSMGARNSPKRERAPFDVVIEGIAANHVAMLLACRTGESMSHRVVGYRVGCGEIHVRNDEIEKRRLWGRGVCASVSVFRFYIERTL